MASSCKEADVIDLTGSAEEEEQPHPPKRRRGSTTRPPSANAAEVVIIDDDPPPPRAAAKPAAAATAAPQDVAPPWAHLTGTKRVLSEFKHLSQAVASGTAPCYDLQMPEENNAHVWRFKLRDFDTDLPGGRALNDDLARLHREYGVDHILCEVTFPSSYPSKPFLLRLVYPRCCWYTGHVTAGGSVCVEALTQTGTANSWRSDFCVSGLLPLVRHNFIDVDAVQVRTATGPGGTAGPLRVDFGRRWHSCRTPLEPYSKHEAEAAFARTETHHRAHGW